eukprot:2804695-Pleurochrysis_carterae.AAC.1
MRSRVWVPAAPKRFAKGADSAASAAAGSGFGTDERSGGGRLGSVGGLEAAAKAAMRCWKMLEKLGTAGMAGGGLADDGAKPDGRESDGGRLPAFAAAGDGGHLALCSLHTEWSIEGGTRIDDELERDEATDGFSFGRPDGGVSWPS